MSNDLSANPQALTQQLISAANRLSDEEAAQRYQQILAQLPPDQAAELNAMALSQVKATDRRQLAGKFRQAHEDPQSPFDGYQDTDDDAAATPQRLGLMAARAQQQDPRLLGNLLGEDSPLRGPIGKAALAALAALLIRRLQSSQGGSGQGLPAGSADQIGAIIDALLGGAAGGLGGQPAPTQSVPGGGLGDLLGGLLGGAASGLGSQPTPAPTQSAPAPSVPAPTQSVPGGGLGDLLGGLLGGGAGTQHLPAGGDLGSLLSSILHGGAAAPDENAVGSHRREGLHVGGKQ